MNQTCANCRHFVPLDGTPEVGACRGAGALIWSYRRKEWTEDRKVFEVADEMVGYLNYCWRGRAVSLDNTCENWESRWHSLPGIIDRPERKGVQA